MAPRVKWIGPLLTLLVGSGFCVEVNFEHVGDGFFYRRGSAAAAAGAAPPPPPDRLDGQPADVRLFTLRDPRQPVLVRASHGPFSTRQSVPVPMPLESGASVNITDPLHFHARAVHVSAHLVTAEVPQERPVLRVLVTAGRPGPAGGARRPRPQLCVTVMVSRGRELLTAHCQPDQQGVCLAEVMLPAAWWPRRRPPATGATLQHGKKPTKNQVGVSYLLSRAGAGAGGQRAQCAAGEVGLPSQPVTSVGVVPLTQSRDRSQLQPLGEHVRLAVPQGPLYPNSQVYIPVYVTAGDDSRVFGFTLRVRVRQGLQVQGAELASDRWNISVTSSRRGRSVAVTAYGTVRPGADTPSTDRNAATIEGNSTDGLYEAFTLLLRVDERPDVPRAGEVVWRVLYLPPDSGAGLRQLAGKQRRKLVTKLVLRKDDTQIVLPMAKTWELVNTAMLTGHQVTEQLRVFVVTQAGDVADVTLKSSCRSTDESVLKVSSSCTSVYLDGSEARGSQNATVVVDYGTYQGAASFRVWVPEEPLEIEIADAKLSQIEGWRVPQPVTNKHPNQLHRVLSGSSSVSDGGSVCQLRYQQTPIEVYAKFVSRDDNSGRVSYVAGRKISLRVTDLVRDHLRVADPQIATLSHNRLQGRSPGRTKVQLLSPITGAEVASRQFRVTDDHVTVTSLEARVISGLVLLVSHTGNNEYSAVSSVTNRLTAQYQEGLLEMTLALSDGSRTPLSSVSSAEFQLDVESLDPRVVALAPQVASSQPRVLAIGPGKGKLLKVRLQALRSCRQRFSDQLAATYAHVEVAFAGQLQPSAHVPEGVQNDASHLLDRPELYGSGTSRHGLQQVMEDARKAGKLPAASDSQLQLRPAAHQLQPLEIGMFVLLAVFCIVIAVFIVACFIYAGQVKRAQKLNGQERRDRHSSHANAQDWVWLGRGSLEPRARAAPASAGLHNQPPTSDMNANVDRFPPASVAASSGRQLNITVNPLTHKSAATGDNPHPHMSAASDGCKKQKQAVKVKDKVDSRTFVKRKSPEHPLYQNVGFRLSMESGGTSDSQDDTGPPVPRHFCQQASPPVAPPDGRPAMLTFVSPHQAARQSPAIKHASVVENSKLRGQREPRQLQQQRVQEEEEEEEAATGTTSGAARAAAELGLGMDYDELMRYFDNLKESTA